MNEHDEEAAIREYVLSQSPDGEVVRHAEKLVTKHLYGDSFDVWDVRTRRERWWVITNPTNLYSQRDFQSMDLALTFHIGLGIRLAHRNAPPVEDDEVLRLAGPWRRWQQAADALDRAVEAEDFQAVGLRCREALLGMASDLSRPEMVPVGAEAPKTGDYIDWSGLIADHVASGEHLRRVRAHLKAVAQSAWELAGWLTHSKSANRAESKIVAEATAHTLAMYTIAVLAAERRQPS